MSDAAARLDPAALPDDASALKAMLVAERGARLDLAEEVTRLTAIVDAFKRAMFGRRSEKLVEFGLQPARSRPRLVFVGPDGKRSKVPPAEKATVEEAPAEPTET